MIQLLAGCYTLYYLVIPADCVWQHTSYHFWKSATSSFSHEKEKFFIPTNLGLAGAMLLPEISDTDHRSNTESHLNIQRVSSS